MPEPTPPPPAAHPPEQVGPAPPAPPDRTTAGAGIVVYVPSERVREGDEQIRLQLLELDGRLTLLAWSSLDGFIAACGDQQAWAGLTEGAALGLAAQLGTEAVLDPPLAPAGARPEQGGQA